MNGDQLITTWLKNPYPLWNTAVSQALVNKGGFASTFDGYSIESALTGRYNANSLVRIEQEELSPSLELPTELLDFFYRDHGLEYFPVVPGQTDAFIKKLNGAFGIIKSVSPVYEDITHLVRTIQILKSDQSENDVSYSHPKIPFSIFLSLCEEESKIADLRVAESIIHESMHLKLTLVENRMPLVKLHTENVFYSPWRGESRPVRGVLHGLFVFRVILDFYRALQATSIYKTNELFLSGRISTIKSELYEINSFAVSPGLTEYGKIFVAKLLQN